MPVMRMSKNFEVMTDCWFPVYLNHGLAPITQPDLLAIEAWINTFVFDQALLEASKMMNVTVACRRFLPHHPNWDNSPLEALWRDTGQNEQRAAWLYGNFVCRIGVSRSETWWVFKQGVGPDKDSSTYVLGAYAKTK